MTLQLLEMLVNAVTGIVDYFAEQGENGLIGHIHNKNQEG